MRCCSGWSIRTSANGPPSFAIPRKRKRFEQFVNTDETEPDDRVRLTA